MIDVEIARKLVEETPWHHDWEIIPGVRTNGSYDPEGLWNELRLPDDMQGLSLADVGASNGYFSFEASKRGAHVTAFDFRHRDNSGFGLAQHINGMTHLRHYQINVLQMNPEIHGQFDVVLALGLLYHVADPYRALVNCASLSKEALFIESHCIDASVPDDMKEKPVMVFHTNPARCAEHSLGNDPSNFHGFTSACLRYMVEDVGFTVRRSVVRQGRAILECVRTQGTPTTRLDIAYGLPPRVERGKNRNDPRSWHIF